MEKNCQPLWKHQAEEIFEHGGDASRALFWDPRLGKTRAVVSQLEGLSRILIVCPKTVASVWNQEIDTDHFVVDLTQGTLEERSDSILRMVTYPQGRFIAIVNYDVVFRLLPELLLWKPEMVVSDESHLIKRASAKRSRALHALGRRASYKRILSGTPTPQSYKDIYSQYKFLAPEIFGTNQEDFTDKYCILDTYYRNRVIGYHNLDELKEKMNSVASRVKREDAMDIPQVQEVVRDVLLPNAAASLYDELEQEGVSRGYEIDATHTLTRMLRLHQITAGVMPIKETIIHSAKSNAVVEELSEILYSGKKAVVFHRFKPEGEHLDAAIRSEYGDIVSGMNGDTPAEYRTKLLDSFEKDPELQVLVVQEQLGLGVSMAAADYCIFTSCGFQYDVHAQARDRIVKPGGKLCYIYLVVPGTVDEIVLRAIRRKKDVSELLFEEAQNDD